MLSSQVQIIAEMIYKQFLDKQLTHDSDVH